MPPRGPNNPKNGVNPAPLGGLGAAGPDDSGWSWGSIGQDLFDFLNHLIDGICGPFGLLKNSAERYERGEQERAWDKHGFRKVNGELASSTLQKPGVGLDGLSEMGMTEQFAHVGGSPYTPDMPTDQLNAQPTLDQALDAFEEQVPESSPSSMSFNV